MRRNAAFTLIELLVVVAIIVALLAILLPSLNRAVALSEQAVCLSNHRQMGNASLEYMADNQREYPPKYFGTQFSWLGKNGSEAGYNVIYPRLRPWNKYLAGDVGDDDEVPFAKCPSDRGALSAGQSEYDRVGTSYASNTNPGAGGLTTNATGQPGIRMEQVRSPGRMVVMSEFGAYALAWWSAAQWASTGGDHYFWHGDPFYTPKLFADGHAAYGRSEIATLSAGEYTYHRDQ